ncbi:MAG: stage II sporulation protein M [Candidatus Hadarchaeota archaeon]
MGSDGSIGVRLKRSLSRDFPKSVRENRNLILAVSLILIVVVFIGALTSSMDFVLKTDAGDSVSTLDSGEIPGKLMNELGGGVSPTENASVTVIENGQSWNIETEHEFFRIVEGEGDLRVYRMEKNAINELGHWIQEYFRRGIQEEVPEDPFELTKLVLRNNMVTVVTSIGAGVAFGVEPIIVLFINSLLIGYVVSVSLSLAGTSALELSSLLLPHGVFEFPGLILTISCGIRLGAGALNSLRRGSVRPLSKAGGSAMGLIPGILLLFIIAGFVEGFISPVGGTTVHYLKVVGSVFALALVLFWMIGRFGGSEGR